MELEMKQETSDIIVFNNFLIIGIVLGILK